MVCIQQIWSFTFDIFSHVFVCRSEIDAVSTPAAVELYKPGSTCAQNSGFKIQIIQKGNIVSWNIQRIGTERQCFANSSNVWKSENIHPNKDVLDWVEMFHFTANSWTVNWQLYSQPVVHNVLSKYGLIIRHDFSFSNQ